MLLCNYLPVASSKHESSFHWFSSKTSDRTRHGNTNNGFRTTTAEISILLKYYNNAVHVLYKTQEMRFSRSVSKDDGGKEARCLHSHVKWLYSAIKSIVL